MKSTIRIHLGALLMVLLLTSFAAAHCEIPCGIYTDEMRVHMIREDLDTIEKSMKSIIELSAAGEKNYNQLVRWIDNKELHANKIQEVVTQYWLTQRIKPADPADKEAYDKYLKEVALLHQMLVQAMKCKQTTDVEHVKKLHQLLDDFSVSYFGKKVTHEHSH